MQTTRFKTHSPVPQKNWTLNKRHKIVITTVALSIGFLLVTQNINVYLRRYYFIFIFALITYLLSFWSLREGMTKAKAIYLLILPTLFSLAATSFYFTFREIRWLTRIPATLAFGFMMYTLLLSQNVFNVAAIRNIPLYRASSTASFVFTLVTAFFLFSVVSTFEINFYWNFALVFAITFPLTLQYLWSIEMSGIDKLIFTFSFVLSLISAELAASLSFWPVNPIIWSLLITVSLYINLGIASEYYRKRLTIRGIFEYLSVGAFVLIISFLVASWNS